MQFWKVHMVWAMALACTCPALLAQSADAHQPASAGRPNPDPLVTRAELSDTFLPTASLGKEIIWIPADASGKVLLETSIYKPDGPGPFPMIVFNHGKNRGDSHEQSRSEPLSLAREFFRRGYVVVAPNRRGFAHSGGAYAQHGCDILSNGWEQAADIAATVDFMSRQPYVDAQHIVVAGVSHGGLATMAYGANAAPGVRALINFSGGLRQDACTDWQGDLTRAYGAYGEHARVPSLWLYGANDSLWPALLIPKMFATYTANGASARMVDVGVYKHDSHCLPEDRDGVNIWWPPVKAFLARAGMPTGIKYRVADPVKPEATGYAAIDSVDAVPFIDEAGRRAYRTFLQQLPSRAFAVSDSGAWSWAEGGDNPMAVAVANCQNRSTDPCKLYAVDDTVVWSERSPQ